MKRFYELQKLCKCDVILHINPHTISYQTTKEYLEEQFENGIIHSKDVSPQMIEEIVERNTIVELICYDKSPAGFFKTIHWDIECCVNDMLNLLDNI